LERAKADSAKPNEQKLCKRMGENPFSHTMSKAKFRQWQKNETCFSIFTASAVYVRALAQR
jgi:hypothetical protein